MSSQSLIQTGCMPSKKWSSQNLTGQTAGFGPAMEGFHITVDLFNRALELCGIGGVLVWTVFMGIG